MSFLQPMLLAALPIIALPIIIHLINQRRYQTTRWAAMMFLLAANRMSRGYARIRQWLILLFRTLAIAGLIFAISRPLASGWLGMTAGGRADTTIILLDRSPSMQQLGPGAVVSKLETGRQQLAKTLETLGSTRYVLIESTKNVPRELNDPTDLLNLPETEPTSTSADLPAMLQAAHSYIAANQSGRTEIWICSDLRENDWNAESSRWKSLRDSFLEFSQGVRFHLLAYPRAAPQNVAVRVTDVRRQQTSEGVELLVSLHLTREGDSDERLAVPVQLEIDGARSEINVDMVGTQYELKDYRIGLTENQKQGWGRVSIPADANPADNDFYFAFDEPPERHTLIVADDPTNVRPLQLTASISPDPQAKSVATVVTEDQLGTVEWEQMALVLWQAPLPDADVAQQLTRFVGRGGRVVFFPPRSTSGREFMGVAWQDWQKPPKEIGIETWRSDQDILAHTLSGTSLPVGELQIREYCELSGEVTPLAQLPGGTPLLARVTTDHGGVYFCATTPAPSDSTLATNGIVLYVAVQRALASGAEALGNTRQLIAGEQPIELATTWERLTGDEEGLSTEYAFHRGVYTAGDRLLAVNRSAEEEQASLLADEKVAGLFNGLDFARVDDEAGTINSLIEEIWRVFLAIMMVSMIVEAALCLPKIRPTQGAAA
ncbi:hypothetical protein Mal52_01280 [Symmachiella dynata]|uniref:Aerotolerance regulator N-terminal domain-containing protein n=1 Tax=Symmachiella dynata TaxID=2527995 RepID=A0A517ZGR6_9PLAN|nr:BatA domain-containing protein [Symmachiella dynata]QDU41675.1 hypothetical protein Mal52_01280 [Symmachiella dynata]